MGFDLKKIIDSKGWVYTAFGLRILMGLLFIYSGFFKALDTGAFYNIIVMYKIIPVSWAAYPAIVLPFLEMILGLFLIAGYKTRASAFLSILLMGMFTVFIAINVARGETFDCGCFELSRMGIGINENVSITLVIRDLVMLIVLFVIFLPGRQFLSLDSLFKD
ncbi:MAG: DoxX family membrane protein [bacterium]|nr:DoxX family membrane protein [bacterium]